MAFVAACVAHEAVGHGLTCLATGGHVILLTSVYFRCQPGLPIVDAAGPLMNLIVAAAAALALRVMRGHSNCSVFLGLLLAYSGLWGAGYCIFSALTDTGDLAFALHDLALKPVSVWLLVMGIVGIVLYRIICRYASAFLPGGVPLLAAYLAAGAVACCSVLFARGPILPALREAAQEGLLAPVGLLIITFRRSQAVQVVLQPNVGAVIAGVITTLVFWFTLGKGFYS